jgi:formyltetrahydrofolate hydrolase
MTLKQIVAAGQRLEARTLVRAVKLYLEKRLDVFWGLLRRSEARSKEG